MDGEALQQPKTTVDTPFTPIEETKATPDVKKDIPEKQAAALQGVEAAESARTDLAKQLSKQITEDRAKYEKMSLGELFGELIKSGMSLYDGFNNLGTILQNEVQKKNHFKDDDVKKMSLDQKKGDEALQKLKDKANDPGQPSPERSTAYVAGAVGLADRPSPFFFMQALKGNKQFEYVEKSEMKEKGVKPAVGDIVFFQKSDSPEPNLTGLVTQTDPLKVKTVLPKADIATEITLTGNTDYDQQLLGFFRVPTGYKKETSSS